MIKEGVLSTRLKDPRVFDLIRASGERVCLGEAPYRPIRIELELTTKRNDTYRSRGIGALSLQEGRTLTDGQLAALVDQFESISFTTLGGSSWDHEGLRSPRSLAELDPAHERPQVEPFSCSGGLRIAKWNL